MRIGRIRMAAMALTGAAALGTAGGMRGTPTVEAGGAQVRCASNTISPRSPVRTRIASWMS